MMDRLKKIISKGGPNKGDYAELKAAISSLDSLSQEEEAELVDLISPVLCLSTMQGHAYHKPHGYAGDFEIIDKIFSHWKSNDPSLNRWDDFFHSQEAPIAVRNRKKYFINLVSEIEERRSRGTEEQEKSCRVLNIGSGPARDVKEYCELNSESKAIFDCIEPDEEAILYASGLCSDYLHRVRFINKNIFRFKAEEKYDLIWSAGLLDYFSDKQFILLLKRLINFLEPDGELVVGNFCKGNPSRNYMEKFGKWFLNHRAEEELIELAISANVSIDSVRVYREEMGVNLFLHIKGCCGQVKPDTLLSPFSNSIGDISPMVV